MQQRRLVWVTVATCVVLAGFSAAWLTWPQPHTVNRANFERIQQGMTRAEVEAILNCPPGEYATESYFSCDNGPSIPGETLWTSNEGQICIWFDRDGRVTWFGFKELVFLESPGLLERLRTWLGW